MSSFSARDITRPSHVNGRPLSQDLARLLDRGVAQGIIDESQRERLAALDASDASAGAAPAVPPPARTALPASTGDVVAGALSVVAVAYALGALLVLFACGWFLVDRWARLGAWGVLGVALLYAGVLLAAERWLRGRGFVLAADICAALVVSLSPLVAWPFLSLGGRWPNATSPEAVAHEPLLHDTAWMAWQWLILELVMLLTALATLRRRPMVTVTWPMAGALAGAGLHLSIIARSFGGSSASEQWMLLAGGFAILLVAERVERWQRAPRRPAGGFAADGARTATVAGDFANAFWVLGLAGTTLGFMVLWLRADDSPWRHILLPTALGLVALSLYVRRRTVLLFGVLGVIGYLGFLAQHVFREFISFPILLAGLGILVILATVWTQTRFPALVDRLEARRGSDERPFPWSGVMAALPIGVALAMSTLSYPEVREEREQDAFRQRLHILRTHSGSLARQSARNIRPPGS